MRVAVVWCAVAEADAGGGLRWLEPMMEAVCMHVWSPCRALSCRRRCSIIRSDELYFFILKKVL
jgi:hypothetical protein